MSTRPGDDADVGAAVEHAVRDLCVRFFLKVDVDPRMARQEARQDLGHEVADRGGVGEHPQMAAQAAAVFGQFGTQLAGLVQHQPRVVEKGLARRQQAHAARFARQQRNARLRLQRLDAGAGRGQRQVLALGRAREAAELGGGDEEAQIRQVELHGSGILASLRKS